MPSQPPSSFSSSAPSARKQRWTREQLLKSLEILGSLSAPLPPDLLSPPSSPLPQKRKLLSSADPDPIKRPRVSTPSDKPSQHPPYHHHHHHHHPHHPHHPHYQQPPPPQLPRPRPANQPTNFSLRSEPSEDGELREDPVSFTSRTPALPVLSNTVPVRRPRRGKVSSAAFDELHDKYHKHGRMLKYSGDARFWSTYPSSHKEYRPLADPPPPNSPYHKYGGLIARLELVDALVCFTYSLWSRDYSRRTCHRETWATIEAFLGWCKNKWQSEDTLGDRERALLGLIWMIEAFIRSRTFYYMAKTIIDPELDRTWTKLKNEMALLSREAEKADLGAPTPGQLPPLGSQQTPPMLPSPASIAPPSSANSTPITTASSGGTPSSNLSSNTLNTSQVSSVASRGVHPAAATVALLPSHLLQHVPNGSDGRAPTPSMVAAAARASVALGPAMLHGLKEQSTAIIAASYCMDQAQRYLSLPIMARHYPTTFARMMGSSLAAHEEQEPDIEDEEGELLWPTQAVTGEGLGWVCLMGKAMIKELGKDVGYVGLAGVVRKPDAAPSGASPMPPDLLRQVSVQR